MEKWLVLLLLLPILVHATGGAQGQIGNPEGAEAHDLLYVLIGLAALVAIYKKFKK